MDYDFVCNALTFNTLNEKIKDEIEKITEAINEIEKQINIITDTNNWEASENDGVKLKSNVLINDLKTSNSVLNNYLELLLEERENSATLITELQTSINNEFSTEVELAAPTEE